MPVAATASIVQDKVAHALLAASGRSFADIEEARSFARSELDFAISGTFGGATTCVEIEAGDPANGDAFILCDMGSGLRGFGLDAMRRC
ncbi:MAG: MBL fold metallo-hydrolase, partial [Novosphingobium sp.]